MDIAFIFIYIYISNDEFCQQVHVEVGDDSAWRALSPVEQAQMVQLLC